MIDAALFDFTGVITTSPFDAIAEFEIDNTLEAGTLRTIVLGDYGALAGDHPWHRFERGEITFAEYYLGLLDGVRSAGIDIDVATLMTRFTNLEVHAGVVERIISLRERGLRTALVTNNVRETTELWRRLVPIDAVFDAVVESWAAAVRKPDPRIYELALERLGGVQPSRAVMLDDAVANVEGARAAGLHGIHVTDPHAALDELECMVSGGA